MYTTSSFSNQPSTAKLPMMPDECQKLLREFWKTEKSTLRILFPIFDIVECEHPTDILFLKNIPVTPVCTRPATIVNGRMTEHPRSANYKKIAADALACGYISHVISSEKENGQPALDAEAVVGMTLFLYKCSFV